MNTKEEIRKFYGAQRMKLTANELDEASLAIANHLLPLPIWDFDYYHMFLQIAEQAEIDTSYLLSILQGRDKEVVVPRVAAHNELDHILLTDNTRLVKNRWNIPEPEKGIKVPAAQIDVVFVPLFVFDKQGHRVGYGGGYYDRFLSQCRPETLRIGLSLFDPVEKIPEQGTHDVALDYGVTPFGSYSFSD